MSLNHRKGGQIGNSELASANGKPNGITNPDKSQIAKRDLTQGDIAKNLYSMAMPMVGGLLATMSFNVVDTLFVAGLGKQALAALSFTFPVVMLVISLSIGLGAGTTSAVSVAVGEKDNEKVKQLITAAMLLTAAVTMPVALLGLATVPLVFSLLGAEAEIIPLIGEYMYTWYCSVPFIAVPMVGLAAIRALGMTKVPAILMITIAIVNAVLDPILIYGWFGIPAFGIQGASLASLTVRVASLFVVFYYLHVKLALLVNPLSHISKIAHHWKTILHVGVPAMATNMIIPVSSAIVVSVVASHGEDAIAGFGVATRIEAISLILFYALSSVIGPFCGQNLGAKSYDRLIEAQKICAKFCIMAGLTICFVLALLGPIVTPLFCDNDSVVGFANSYLWIVPFSYMAYGMVMVANASFNGLRRPLPGVLISSARVIFVLMPLVWLGNQFFGVAGVYTAIAISNLSVGVLAYFMIVKYIKGLNFQSNS